MASRFGQIYLRSLIASAEQRVDLHRSKGRRLRLRTAERRLRKLQAYEEWRSGPVGTIDRRSVRVALLCSSVLWIMLASLLGVVELGHGSALRVTILLVFLLALTVAWFRLAVLCIPTIDDHEGTPPQPQPTAPATGDRRRAVRGGPMPVFEYLRVAGFDGTDRDSYVSRVE